MEVTPDKWGRETARVLISVVTVVTIYLYVYGRRVAENAILNTYTQIEIP